MEGIKKVDYIIVGQGLAGSATALQALKRNRKILVIDKQSNNTSSRIAAGLFNPITGKKMTKTWLADKLFPYLNEFYQYAEKCSGKSFFNEKTLFRPFLSIEEQNEWMAKSADNSIGTYIANITTHQTLPNVSNQHGGLFLQQCGYLDTRKYIDAVRGLIAVENIILDQEFNQDHLHINGKSIEYQGIQADKIIFCQGCATYQNKWFGWIPVKPLKGETITIKTNYDPQHIINRGVYVVPSDNGELRVGATYNFNDQLQETTEAGKAELIEKLSALVSFDFEVTGQQWGLRPTVPDRKPLVGAHPELSQMIVFNGLGTKGVSLAPYLSELLFQWMENGIDLIPEIDVNRYKLLYSKFTK